MDTLATDLKFIVVDCDVDAASSKHSPLQSESNLIVAQLHCFECDYTTNDCISLYKHITSHNDERTLKCQYCDYVCHTESILTVHTKSHILKIPTTDVKPRLERIPAGCVKTEILERSLSGVQSCSLEFPKKEASVPKSNPVSTLPQRNEIAVKKESIENYVQTKDCRIFCSRLAMPLQNKVSNKTSVPKQFKCDHPGCIYSTDVAADIEKHLSFHSQETTFKCRMCQESFDTSDYCYRHEEEHVKRGRQSRDKKKCSIFRCLWCQFTCKKESQLIIHCRRPHRSKKNFRATFETFFGSRSPSPEVEEKQEDFQETAERNEGGHLQDVEFFVTNNCVEFPILAERPVTSELLFVQPSPVGSDEDPDIEVVPPDTVNCFPFFEANEVSSFTTVSTTVHSDKEDKPIIRRPRKKEPSATANSRRFKCNRKDCTFSSAYLKNLTMHIFLKHSLKKRKFQCRQCDKRFLQAQGLERHMKIHVDGYPYCCTECNYGTQYHSTLRRHVNKYHRSNLR